MRMMPIEQEYRYDAKEKGNSQYEQQKIRSATEKKKTER